MIKTMRFLFEGVKGMGKKSFFAIIVIQIMQVNSFQTKFNLYNESRWDPLVYDKDIENNDRLDIVRSQSGHLELHYLDNEPANFKRFGDVSVLTLNLFREVIVDLETIQSAENVRTILDETHVSLLCLQGVDDTLLARINGKLSKQTHYAIANIDKYDNDMLTGQHTYMPIIYDTKLFFSKNNGFFETEGKRKMVYGSFLELKDARIPELDVAFTIINIDMFSSFNDVISAQFSNIISDIATFKEVSESPVIIAGSIGTVPPNVKDLISRSYLNTIDIDKNNNGIPRTTIHSGNQDDGVQRDFILIHDEKKVFTLNYSRILREFLAGDHYPVHAIFSYTNTINDIENKKDRDSVSPDQKKEEEVQHEREMKDEEDKIQSVEENYIQNKQDTEKREKELRDREKYKKDKEKDKK